MTTPSFAKPLLMRWGIKVSDIPTSSKQESDFLAEFGMCRVLIEEKTKFDDPIRHAQRIATLAEGEVYGTTTRLVRSNRLSGLIGDSAKQLMSSSEKQHDFRLVWFTSTGDDSEARFHQFIATIYGSTNIIEMNASHYKRCYFYRNSDFHRYANIIDGAIVAHASEACTTLKLCLNPLSPRYEALRDSTVVEPFSTAVEDPIALERRGEVFIVDSNIDRNDENGLHTFLQLKYNTLPLMKVDMGFTSASVLLKSGNEPVSG